MHSVIHLTGPVLLGPHEERPEAWIVGGRMTYTAPPGPAETVAGWVLPGLVDAHCHIGLVPGGAPDRDAALAHARAEAAAGVLLVRDCGSPTDTRWLQAHDGAPRLVRAGRHLARSRRYLRGLALEVEPEDLVDAVRVQARAGDGWVKIVADWIDRDAGDLGPAFPAGVVREAVAAAHEEGARVTAHTFAEETIDALLDAGIDCLEHATGLQTRHIPRLAEAGIPIVPTLVNVATFPQIAARGEAKFPRYAAHMRALWEGRHERIAAAHAAGVPIYAGTDAGTVIAHGRIADEVAELARAIGLPAALDAASWGARAWLGGGGDRRRRPGRRRALCRRSPAGRDGTRLATARAARGRADRWPQRSVGTGAAWEYPRLIEASSKCRLDADQPHQEHPVTSATPAATSRPTPPARDILPADLTMGTVMLKVGDMKLMLDYYERALGLVPITESLGGVYLGRKGLPVIHLSPAAGLQIPGRGEAGLFHTAILFDNRADLAATVATAAQYDPRLFAGSADHLVSEAFYFTDPEGNGVELYFDKPRDTWRWSGGEVVMDSLPLPPQAFLNQNLTEASLGGQRDSAAGIGHVHLQVGDVETAHAFYVDTLGFEKTSGWHGQALFVSAGGYHHHMAMNVWNSRGAGPRKDTLGLGEVLIGVPGQDDVLAAADRLKVAGISTQHTGAELRFEDPWRNQIRMAVVEA